MARAQTDVAFRWFLDLGLSDAVPNHTSDTYFRNRIGVERFGQVFQDLVTQAREHGLVKDRLRLKDATHLLASAADLAPRALVAQVRDRLLAAAEPFFAEWVAEQRARLETLRQTTAEHPEVERLAARIAYLREIAVPLRERVTALPAVGAAKDAKRQRLANALALAEKLLADCDDPSAGNRLVNAVDPEARTGWHGGIFLGYVVDLIEDADSEIITAINVMAGNGAEAADAIALIEQEEAAQGNDVAGLSMDGAGFNGPMLRELTDPAGLNLEVTVPPPPPPAGGAEASDVRSGAIRVDGDRRGGERVDVSERPDDAATEPDRKEHRLSVCVCIEEVRRVSVAERVFGESGECEGSVGDQERLRVGVWTGEGEGGDDGVCGGAS